MNTYLRIINALMDEEIDPELKAQMQQYVCMHTDEKKLEEAFLKYADTLKPYTGKLKGEALESYNKLIARLNIQQAPQRKSWYLSTYWRIAAVMIPFVAAVGAIWLIGGIYNDTKMHIVSADHPQSVFLPDSTHVVVTAGSHLLYRETADTRNVELTGEAFFKVKRDTLKPFHVSTSNIRLAVLGTEFRISETPAIVSLYEGSVMVETNGMPTTLAWGERLTRNPKTGVDKRSIIPSREMIAEGYKPRLIFDRCTLGEVLNALEVYYATDITTAPNVSTNDGKLTLNLENMSFPQAVDLLIKISREDLAFSSVDGAINITKK